MPLFHSKCTRCLAETTENRQFEPQKCEKCHRVALKNRVINVELEEELREYVEICQENEQFIA